MMVTSSNLTTAILFDMCHLGDADSAEKDMSEYLSQEFRGGETI